MRDINANIVSGRSNTGGVQHKLYGTTVVEPLEEQTPLVVSRIQLVHNLFTFPNTNRHAWRKKGRAGLVGEDTIGLTTCGVECP